MAAGKSTKLVEMKEDKNFFGYSFFDLDAHIFNKHGQDFPALSNLIEEKGFNWFRETELNSLQEIWTQQKNTITALGGGTLTPDVLKLIQNIKDIKGYYLKENFETCYKRIKETKTRPLGKLSKAKLRLLYEDRANAYERFEVIN